MYVIIVVNVARPLLSHRKSVVSRYFNGRLTTKSCGRVAH